MAKITRGGTVTDYVTASILHGLVDNATIADVGPGDIDANWLLARIGAQPDSADSIICVPPTVERGAASASTDQVVQVYYQSNWIPVGPQSWGTLIYNNTGGTITAGYICCRAPTASYVMEVDLQSTATPASNDGDEDVWCVAAADISTASYGVGIVYGQAWIWCENTPSAKHFVKTGATAGKGYAETWTKNGTGPNYIAQVLAAGGADTRSLCWVFGHPLKGG